MTVHPLAVLAKAPSLARWAARTVERPLRMTTGLVVLAFVASHFVNHAFGIRSVDAMQAASTYLIMPWQTLPGLLMLYCSLVIHGALGLYAVFRRRHLWIPAGEAWQLALGLAIPLLLLAHAGTIRIGTSHYELEYPFVRVLYSFWVESPDFALPRQVLLMLVVWVHACIGLRTWLRMKPWYGRASSLLAALATLVPALGLAGLVGAGLALRDAVHSDAAFARSMAEAAAAHPDRQSALHAWIDGLTVAYLAIVLGVLALRGLRSWYARRFRAVRVSYPGNRVVSVPPGYSLLEASRWGGIPHASVCGGRGRCSTCRVRVTTDTLSIGAPGPVEARTLRRIGAPPNVRLACQARPQSDLAIQPLVPMTRDAAAYAARFDAAVEGGRELRIAAMFVDMRESTRLATGRLPYDALFLFDRYIQTVTAAIRANRGHATSIAGDGVMSFFGTDGRAELAARNALRAALDVWEGLERLNLELESELKAPLRIGIGIHVGISVIGMVSSGTSQSIQFLGDTGNVAAKLEGLSKELGCTLVASAEAVRLAVPELAGLELRAVTIPGKSEPLEAVALREKAELGGLLAVAPAG